VKDSLSTESETLRSLKEREPFPRDLHRAKATAPELRVALLWRRFIKRCVWSSTYITSCRRELQMKGTTEAYN
jgi:hypothetical protein